MENIPLTKLANAMLYSGTRPRKMTHALDFGDDATAGAHLKLAGVKSSEQRFAVFLGTHEIDAKKRLVVLCFDAQGVSVAHGEAFATVAEMQTKWQLD